MPTQILLTSDHHLFNDPADLTPVQMRQQWFPWLLTRRWFPQREVEVIVHHLYISSWRAMRRLQEAVRDRFDFHVTLGDQVHGISEHGIVGEPGLKIARGFLRASRSLSRSGDLFHVPAEHCLGYWEGEDYFPHLEWRGGWPRFALALRRKFEGAMNMEAVANWLSLFGPLWGVKRVGHYQFVWLCSDFFRWRDRLTGELLQLAQEQDEFIRQTLGRADMANAVLFLHRAEYVFDDPVLRRYQSRLRAVVFGHYHHPRVAAKLLARYGRPEFDLWFVPAVWGTQFGVGQPGYAVLTIDGPDIGLTTASLGR